MVSGGDIGGARLVAVIVAVVTMLFGATAVVAAQAAGNGGGANGGGPTNHPHKKVCGDTGNPHLARCHAEVDTQDDGVTPFATSSPSSGALRPADLQSAYAFDASLGAGSTIAIVDAYDDAAAESDMGAYRAQFGLPSCTTGNGCFRKLNQKGATSPLPSGNSGWAQEIALDLDMASAVCPNCKILLVEADSALFDDLAAAVDTAAANGANAISNSYGGNEFNGEATYESHYNHPGIAITVSSGDNGYGAQYPATSQYVTAVGGTHLVRASNARGWTETAWSGAGSGCSAYIAKPAWQTDAGCAKRTMADVAAVADPSTGVAVYNSIGSSGGNNWYVVGGTSASAPIIAGVYALGGASSNALPYAHTGALNDVTSGSNGSCSQTYLCNARAGYDGPTGLGTPNGLGAFGGVDNSTSGSTTTSTTGPTTTTTVGPTTTTTVGPTTTTSTTVAGNPPSAPRTFSATKVRGTPGVSLAWQPPRTPGCSAVTGYNLYRSTSPGNETLLTTLSPGTSYQDSSATRGVRYYYKLAAVNNCGEGRKTSEANAVAA